MKTKLYLVNLFLISLICISSTSLKAQNKLIDRGILGPNQMDIPVVSGTADFFVCDSWMKTNEQSIPIGLYNGLTGSGTELYLLKGVGAHWVVKNDQWKVDSVELFMMSKTQMYINNMILVPDTIRFPYQNPKLDSLQIVIWQGKPCQNGSRVFYGDSNMRANVPFKVKWTDTRVAKRKGANNDINYAIEDTSYLFSIVVDLQGLVLPKGEYYFTYLLQSSNPSDDKYYHPSAYAEALVYNQESEYIGSDISLDYRLSKTQIVSPITAENGALYLALNLWGEKTGVVSKDIQLNQIEVKKKCDMTHAEVAIQIENIESSVLNMTNNFHLYYAVDAIYSEYEGPIAARDTIAATFEIENNATSIAAGEKLWIRNIRPIEGDRAGVNMRNVGENSQLRVWFTAEDDQFLPNNYGAIEVRNPGADLIKERGESEVEYYMSYGSYYQMQNPTMGLTTAYPISYTPTSGGWKIGDTLSIYLKGLGYNTVGGISWKAPELGVDDQTNQWLFLDCLEMEAGVPYTVRMNYFTMSENFDIEVILASDSDPATKTKQIETNLVLKTDSIWPDAYNAVFKFTPQTTGVQRIGIRQATAVKSGAKRTSFLINGIQVIKQPDYRISMAEFRMPVSGCGLGVQDSFKVSLRNAGYTDYVDSLKIVLKSTNPSGEVTETTVYGKISMPRRMELDKSVQFTIPYTFNLSEIGEYIIDAQVYYRNMGNYHLIPIPGGMPEEGKVMHYEPISTPIARDFSTISNLENWKDISDPTKGGWVVNTTDVGFDGESGCLIATGEARVSNAWYKSSCIQLSADSLYRISLMVKYGGQGSSGASNRPTLDIVRMDSPNKNSATIRTRMVYTYKEWTEISYDFVVPSDKIYYIGLIYSSNYAEISDLRLDNFSLTAVGLNRMDTIRVSVNDTNMGTANGGGVYKRGNSLSLIATPKSIYEFDAWKENNTTVSTDSIYTFTVENARDLVAYFKEPFIQKYQLTLNSNNAFFGSVKGEGKYAAGEEVKIEAEASDIGVFVAWMLAGDTISKEAVYTISMPAQDMSYEAIFDEKKDSIAIEKNEWGNVSIYSKNQTIYIKGLLSHTRIEILDALGRIINEVQCQESTEVSILKSGIYILRMTNEKGRYSQKIMLK